MEKPDMEVTSTQIDDSTVLSNEFDSVAQRGEEYSIQARTFAAKQKNRRKKIRICVQYIILLSLLAILLQILVSWRRYTPADAPMQNESFIAISYFGVERFDSGSGTLISQDRLREHIEALRAIGYTTITQQQVIDFYSYGSPLPEKALLLVFEDGRRDTAVYSQKILENNNYTATMLNYANRLEMRDNKFLSARDLKVLMDTGYWELGSNGYRLEYINVYDRYRNYFGHLNSEEFNAVTRYLGRDYNHYLMDFIRDEDRLHAETLGEMEQRVKADYSSMRYIYENALGFMPRMYALMHSNSDRFGNDPYVSSVNGACIRADFALNINREGSCLNARDISAYDLTRMQPQANWYSNHLIMRVADDTGHSPVFTAGDENEAAKWEIRKGAAEFRGDTIVLTSEPDSYGRMLLPQIDLSDFRLSTTLTGNVAGNSGIGVRSDKDMQNAIYISIEDNWLYVRKIAMGVSIELYRLDLFEFDGGAVQSLEENEKEGMLTYGNAVLQYDSNYLKLQEAHSILSEWEAMETATLQDGAEEYVPAIQLNDRGKRYLEIAMQDDNLTIAVDGRTAIRNLQVGQITGENHVYLESSALSLNQYSQRNLMDDVYDAVYTNLTVSDPYTGEIHYEYTLGFWESVGRWFRKSLQDMANFFINSF